MERLISQVFSTIGKAKFSYLNLVFCNFIGISLVTFMPVVFMIANNANYFLNWLRAPSLL